MVVKLKLFLLLAVGAAGVDASSAIAASTKGHDAASRHLD